MRFFRDQLVRRENGFRSITSGAMNSAARMDLTRYRYKAGSPADAQASAMQAAQNQNMMARNAIIDRAIELTQVVSTQTFTGGAVGQLVGQVINVPVRNVGLLKRFIVEITANVTQGAAETQNQSKLGISNFFSNVTFTDLSNQTRINTAGWHLHLLATARRQAAFGASFLSDSPVQIGSNFSVVSAPAAITTVRPVRMFYEVPITYGDFDFRGGIYANVVNATMNLQFTINPNFFVATGANATLACYQSTTAQLGILSSVVVTVYQQYLDQLPMTQNGVVLPQMDLSTAYLLNNTAVLGLSANQELPIPYANYRNFMSTFAIYDNAGVLNSGTDVAYWAMQSANYTNLYKLDPFILSLFARQTINNDFPQGCYYFNHRAKPVSTIQYGNMQLVLNPSAVTGGTSQVLVGYEALAAINQIVMAGSLYGT